MNDNIVTYFSLLCSCLVSPAGIYDVVLIVGGLSDAHLPVTIMRELWKVAKPGLYSLLTWSMVGFLCKLNQSHDPKISIAGGYVCVTTRGNESNKEYKNHLECILSEMEKEGLWTRICVMEVDDWEKGVTEQESGYIPGAVYLYRKSE